MTDLAIDTHRFVKKLMESGFSEAQAETLADAQVAFLEARLVTKDEVRTMEVDQKNEIGALRAEMKTAFTTFRSEISVILIRSQIASGAAIITVLSFINYLTG